MIDFSDKTQLICFIAIVAAIAALLALTIVIAARMRKRLSGGAFAGLLTLAIVIMILGIFACLTSLAYNTELLGVDSAIEGNALAFQYNGETVFAIPYLGVFFEVVFDRASIELLLYTVTLVDLALLVVISIRRGLTVNVYDYETEGEGYYTVGDDEPGAFAATPTEETSAEPPTEKTPETPITESTVSPDDSAETTETAVPEDKPAPIEEASIAVAEAEISEETPAAKTEEKPAEPAAPAVNKAALVEQVMRRIESAKPAAEELERAEAALKADENAAENSDRDEIEAYRPESVEDILSRMTAQPAGNEPGAPAVAKPIKPVIAAPERKPRPATRKIVVPIKSASAVLTKGEKTAVIAPETPVEAPPAAEKTETAISPESTREQHSEITPEPIAPETVSETATTAPEQPEREIDPEPIAEKETSAPETPVTPAPETTIKPLPERPAVKRGRATVKSRAAAMFDEYLTGRSAEDREKLLGSIDVITKKND